MGLELFAVLRPARAIETAVWREATDGRIRHRQRMVGVVVREQALAAECQHAVEVAGGKLEAFEFVRSSLVTVPMEKIETAVQGPFDLVIYKSNDARTAADRVEALFTER